jgi:hypothetical protein
MVGTAFISYASEDETVATTISAFLERNGVPCWIASRDVQPGADYGSEIINGIEASRLLVLVLSEHANASEFVKREVERAVSKGKPVFPVRVQDVAPSKSLELFVSSAEWIDAFHPPLERYLGRLTDSIRSATDERQERRSDFQPAGPAPKRDFQKTLMIALAVAVVVLSVLLARSLLRGPVPSEPTATRPAGFDPPPTASPAADSPPAAPARPAATAGSTPTLAAVLSPTDPCPRYLGISRELPTPFTCSCSAEATTESSVWGTDVYTDDSGLCRAALHAGVITPQGGSITVNRTAGRELYVGSTRNGVTSNDFPAFPVSVEFQGAAPPVAGPGLCPHYLGVSRELPTPFTCRCTQDAIHSGSVWGTDIYTDDSSLCRAALHAGKVPPSGGIVTVSREAGRQLYVGTTRYGVRSNDFPSFPVSVTFR